MTEASSTEPMEQPVEKNTAEDEEPDKDGASEPEQASDNKTDPETPDAPEGA